MKFRTKSDTENKPRGKFRSSSGSKTGKKQHHKLKRGNEHHNAKGDIHHFENSTYEGQEAFLFATFARLKHIRSPVSEVKNKIGGHPIEDDYRVSMNKEDIKKLSEKDWAELMDIKQKIQSRVDRKNKQRKRSFDMSGKPPVYTDLEDDLADLYAKIPIEERKRKD